MSKSKYIPRRGDVIRLDFNPQTGHEQAGRRPAIVLSPTEYNRKVGLAVVCPITNEQKGYPWEVAIPDNPMVSGTVLADQVKNLDWRQRKAEFICTLDESVLEDVVAKTIALLRPAGAWRSLGLSYPCTGQAKTALHRSPRERVDGHPKAGESKFSFIPTPARKG